MFEQLLCSFHNQGINVTLKPQSDPTASHIVEGYTDEMKQKLYNGMPQRAYTEKKNKYVKRPTPNFPLIKNNDITSESSVPQHFQVEFQDWKAYRRS